MKRRFLLVSLVATLTTVQALAAPTPEEEALLAVLQGKAGAAIRILESAAKATPILRFFAGRTALKGREWAAARRLFEGEAPASLWGRIELLLAERKAGDAAGLALAEMDRALAGAHREALCTLIVTWAAEEAPRDPQKAQSLLEAVLALAPSDTLRRRAEDALFRLPSADDSVPGRAAARARLLKDPDDVLASRVVGTSLAKAAPHRALGFLAPVVDKGERVEALAAARVVVGLDVPAPLRVRVLDALRERFARDAEVAKLALGAAEQLATEDEAAGVAALEALGADPHVGAEALEAAAAKTADPQTRRERFLRVAEREGVSARGERARKQARTALDAAVRAAPEGEARRTAAKAALATPDGAGDPAFLYWALPAGPERRGDVWSLAERFPGDGPWCADLAADLVATGVTPDDAERYARVCSQTGGHAAEALRAFAADEPFLVLVPEPGGAQVLAAGVALLRVSEHRMDPAALFRAASGHPLETEMDAFLMEADLTYELPLAAKTLARQTLRPRGGAALSAMQVRAGDLQGTAIVVRSPLRVEAVVRGDTVAVGVLKDNAPVSGAEVSVRDEGEDVRTVRTDGNGAAILAKVRGAGRLMARAGDGLGFLTFSAEGADEPPRDRFHLALVDRAISIEGALSEVQVLALRPQGEVAGAVRLRSFTTNGDALDEAELQLKDGAALARLWLQGGGRLVALRATQTEKEAEVAALSVPAETRGNDVPVAVRFEPPDPKPGDRLRIRIDDVGAAIPGGRALSVTIHTPWNDTKKDAIADGEPLTLEADLAQAQPGDRIQVTLRLGGEQVVTGVSVGQPARPEPPEIAAVVQQGATVPVRAPAGAWLKATRADGRAAKRWVAPGTALVFPTAGDWRVSAWQDGGESPAVPVRVLDADAAFDPTGRWRGKQATLLVLTAERARAARVVRPGEALGSADVQGALGAYWVAGAAESPPLPVRAPRVPPLGIEGTLTAGAPVALTLGAGLPPGSRLYAVVRDASDHGPLPVAPELQERWQGAPGEAAAAWQAEAIAGDAIDAALLQEEERLAEQRQVNRIDLVTASRSERSSAGGYGGLGLSGMGRGGGGSAGHRVGLGRATRGVAGGRTLGFAPQALARLENGTPGSWTIEIPAYVTAADVWVVARTPGGLWSAAARRLAVGGSGAPVARPDAAPPTLATTWDGSLAGLQAVAMTLPADARRQALAGLVARGQRAAVAPLKAALAAPDGARAGLAVAARLGQAKPPSAGPALGRLEGLPDPRRVERALAALEAAPGDPERGAAVARRLLQEADLPAWVRGRAALALWAAGQADEAAAALSGNDPAIGAVRAVVTGKVERPAAPALWTLARAAAALPHDRALAVQALALLAGPPVAALPAAVPTEPLPIEVQPALAAWRGQTFSRGTACSRRRDHPLEVGTAERVPARRTFPVLATLGPAAVPTRLGCPAGGPWRSEAAFIEVPPHTEPASYRCNVTAVEAGAAPLAVTWYGPDGGALARAEVTLTVDPPRASAAGDPLSPDERYALGTALAREGDAGGMGLLKTLLATDWLLPGPVAGASAALLEGAQKGKDPAALVAAFEGYRERSRTASLELRTAAAVARAYGQVGAHARAVSAARVVLDGRFREELQAIRTVQTSGLKLSSLRLLQELLERYPEVPTVVQARNFAPSVLLEVANDDGDRGGYTRASLRHTAAAELARFLLLHADEPTAPEVAEQLLDTLRLLRDPARAEALAGPLAARYRETPGAWRLSLADAQARFAQGRFGDAERILKALPDDAEADGAVALELGRVYEAQGRRDQALKQYAVAGASEAGARADWLNRQALTLPPLLVLRDWHPAAIEAHLRPGTPVKVTAYRIALENLLLRDGGEPQPDGVRVDGLKPAADTATKVGPAGDVPLPRLDTGAYLLTLSIGEDTYRTLVVRSDLRLVLQDSGNGTLIQLSDGDGRPLADARLWLFGASLADPAVRTDVLGSAFVDGASGIKVLARAGAAYAFEAGSGAVGQRNRRTYAPSAAPRYRAPNKGNMPLELQQKNVDKYQQMLDFEDSSINIQSL